MDYISVGSSGRKRVAEKKEQQYRKGEREEIEAVTESAVGVLYIFTKIVETVHTCMRKN